MVSPYEKTRQGRAPAFSSVELLLAEKQPSLPDEDDEELAERKRTDLLCKVRQKERLGGETTECFSVEDYQRVYAIPGLYEHLFYEKLSCRSLDVIEHLFLMELQKTRGLKEKLRVLDLGAGNGLVGERLSQCARGAKLFERLVGIDMLEEAKSATERDRAGLYHAYYVSDFSQVTPELTESLSRERFNCLTCISRFGFNDIPAHSFANAFNLVEPDAYVLFNLKEDSFPEEGDSAFGRLIRRMLEAGVLLPKTFERYSHYISPTGKTRYHVACIARKRKQIPIDLLTDALD